LLCWPISGIRRLASSLGSKPCLWKIGKNNDLRRTVGGGHDAAAYLYAILLYRDNGGVATDDTAKRYMRWIVVVVIQRRHG
jgi:hypothetical protein